MKAVELASTGSVYTPDNHTLAPASPPKRHLFYCESWTSIDGIIPCNHQRQWNGPICPRTDETHSAQRFSLTSNFYWPNREPRGGGPSTMEQKSTSIHLEMAPRSASLCATRGERMDASTSSSETHSRCDVCCLAQDVAETTLTKLTKNIYHTFIFKPSSKKTFRSVAKTCARPQLLYWVTSD